METDTKKRDELIAEAFRINHEEVGRDPAASAVADLGRVEEGARWCSAPTTRSCSTGRRCSRRPRPEPGASGRSGAGCPLMHRHDDDARLRHPPAVRGGLRHADGGAARVRAVPLRRRSRQPDGGAGHLAGGPPEAARRSSASTIPIVVQFGRFVGNAARFDFGISYQMKQPVTAIIAERAAGNLRARAGGRPVRRRARHPDGRLHRHPSRQLAVEDVPHRVADRRLAADLPDRHPADLRVRRQARRAAVLRPRRGGAHRLLAHRAADRLGPQGADPAGDHARPVPDDAGDAAGALRDAGGAAHRLHQVRPRARAAPSAPSTSATR